MLSLDGAAATEGWRETEAELAETAFSAEAWREACLAVPV